MWNLPLIDAVIVPEDAAIIRQMDLSRTTRPDALGWHFNKTGRYSVKSGYQIERLYPDGGGQQPQYGPTIKPLLAKVWKTKCPPKVRHFMWKTLSGCLSVTKNLRSRGMMSDMRCMRCGAAEETINHVLFECPPAVQAWALSLVPTNIGSFPTHSVFVNMDFLLSRIPSGCPNSFYPWILWYIWKSRNKFFFKNKDSYAQDIVALAQREGRLWEEAHSEINVETPTDAARNETCSPEMDDSDSETWCCFVDGAWKERDEFSGQGWYCVKPDRSPYLMGIRNIRCSISPLHAEFEALIWAMECMVPLTCSQLFFATDCSDLIKMLAAPEDWPAFDTHLEAFAIWKERLSGFSIRLIPRKKNEQADQLARSARRHPAELVHIGSSPPSWVNMDL